MSDKYLLDKNISNILNPFLIVCEGISDARFLSRLLEYKNINTFNVGCPSSAGLGGSSGLDAISKYLLGIYSITVGKRTLRGILIIIDSDDEPSKRFSMMQKALKDAKFPAPTKPFKVEDYDSFRVAVYLMPKEGDVGTLDKLLLDAALKKNPQMNKCLDNFCDCVGVVKSWTQNQQSKMRLSAMVAASCQKNPWASAAIMWSEKDCPVPIESNCFSEIVDFLQVFTNV